MITLEAIRSKIKTLDTMPTVPAIIQPLTSVLQLPPDKVDMEMVVKLVSYDSTIAAQCLRMANSPLFGRKNTETVRSAIMVLGLKRVESILLGCCLNRVVPPDKWALDPVMFWRHSLGCALLSARLARTIGYADPEKAYLGGLLHDLGVLVNTIACTEQYRECMKVAHDRRTPLHTLEMEFLGLTHCRTGKILAQQWNFPSDLVDVIEFHHDVAAATAAPALVALVHLSDLLCRLRDLGYGYYESMGVDLAGIEAWDILAKHYPNLPNLDLARITMDIDGAMDDIVTLVDAVFRPQGGCYS